jgi:subtilisin family serine protease
MRKLPGNEGFNGAVQVWPRILVLLLVLYLILAFILGWFPFQPTAYYPPEEFYIQNQFILSGPEEAVNEVVSRIPVTWTATLKGRSSFDDLGPAVEQCPGLPHSALDLVIDVYEITIKPGELPDAIAVISREAAAVSPDVGVEVNWLTGSPWDPEGSPWDPEGSGWQDLEDVHSASASLFMDQWAFETIELSAVEPGSASVRIGVFDTSPFTDVAPDVVTTKTVDWIEVPEQLELEVLHPVLVASPEPSRQDIDVRNHGLFVAGLIHAVAPDSEIRLIRVLGDDNRGDVGTLNKEIFQFIREANAPGSPPVGTVINMSLGIRVPPEEAGLRLPRQVQSLRYLMAAARCLDIVVVASAGNNSPDSSPPELADLPADWSSVIGVAASNVINERACFSNQGDVAAPGGGVQSVNGGPAKCEPRTFECQGDCPFAVIGPVLTSHSPTGYMYWSGSSFAAPIVSGLAARVLEAGNGVLSPADVRAIIECGAAGRADRHYGEGVINVRETLENCIIPGPDMSAQ